MVRRIVLATSLCEHYLVPTGVRPDTVEGLMAVIVDGGHTSLDFLR